MSSIKILNVTIDNIASKELLAKLKDGGIVFTPNVDHLVKLQKDPEFYDVYKIADYITCDSQVLMYISNFLGQPIQEKISGSDLFPAFYQYYKDDESVKIFLLGAAAGVADRARENINQKVGREMIVGAYSPPFGFEKDEAECDRIIKMIDESGATVLAIGVGAPKQEKWIYKYRDRFAHVKVFLAIGATIDFEAGNRARSPQWMSRLGIEWLHRLLSEPGRLWKRYLVDSLPFFWLIIQQKFNRYRYQRRIGQILEEAALLTPEQIGKILYIKEQKPQKRFGEIIVEEGWLSKETVNFFAGLLTEKFSDKSWPLSRYLQKSGLLEDSELKLLQEKAKISRETIGDIAIQEGLISPKTLDVILEYITPRPERRIGHILQDAGLLSRTQVEKVLEIKQSSPKLRFGEIVVQQNWLKTETIEFFVKLLDFENTKNHLSMSQCLQESGLLNDEQINILIQEHKGSNVPIGELAVRNKWLKGETVEVILEHISLDPELV
ncbi:MAG: WecB/TagA/CpsF family glycosyltransferase [Jaaginema sp. PMC 1079.18]|nr:WecB/TagA/CpsF family glycosyltransferase [Jaaginema sp. PMC 1080.18]MEC4852404.1 WecB/TagA/CpsF family glycosyltransferase [Jaaginema sp. PMC 1079.18]MEC4867319.1 WecB/TagA/CpsF family glycosyltransferase [Jaaginema sp. PMC 1078.18]